MNKQYRWVVLAAGVAACVLVPGASFALDLGDNITISDNISTGTGWYGNHEDQEVEPNCLTGQAWDLEGFFLNEDVLSVVSGFNLITGRDGFDAGDIFLDITGDAQYGPANTGTGGDQSNPLVTSNLFGYDYVLDVDWSAGTYDVYSLSSGTTLRVYYNQNDESNPWRYNSGGELMQNDVGFSYASGLSNADAGGMLGGNHRVASFDLSFLAGEDFISHLTIECGNDNLMGQGEIPSVPEPATAVLFGLGVLLMAGKKAVSRGKCERA